MVADKTCSCGCTFPLVAPPFGREDDTLMLSDGQIRSATPFHHISARFGGSDRWRVVLESESDYVLQLLMPNKPKEEMLGKLRKDFLEYPDGQVRLSIRFVEFMEEEALTSRTSISKVSWGKERTDG